MVHQVETSVDFARDNRLLTWYLGGLNFQVEHHLFPKTCHIHYPAISPIVEATCRAHGISHRSHRDHARRVPLARPLAEADGAQGRKVGKLKAEAAAEAEAKSELQPA